MDAEGNGTGIILGVSIVSEPHGLIREGHGVFRMADPDGKCVLWHPVITESSARIIEGPTWIRRNRWLN